MTPSPSKYVLVYDVGGSHISAALCAEHTYALLGISRAALPADGLSAVTTEKANGNPAFRFVRLIHALGERAIKLADVSSAEIGGAGLAMPGPFDYQNGISQMRHKLQSLYGVDLKAALASRFDWKAEQVGFVNDAAAFLLGEAGAGAAKGFSRSVGITLGTGIGCAYAIDGQIAVAQDKPGGDPGVPPGGEIWNLPYNGGTVEDFVSTRFLRSRYQALTGLEVDVSEVAEIAQCSEGQPCKALEDALARQPGVVEQSPAGASVGASVEARSSAAAVKMVRKASNSARQAFQDFGRHLGLALNQHAGVFQPDVVVLGGGISRASNLFLPATVEALSFSTKVVISTMMDQAPLAGAGVAWFTDEVRSL